VPRDKYNIDQDMGIIYQDIRPWRSYHLESWGNSYDELIENALITEMSQDGEELDTYEAVGTAMEGKAREIIFRYLVHNGKD
jgi:hypothetical protein